MVSRITEPISFSAQRCTSALHSEIKQSRWEERSQYQSQGSCSWNWCGALRPVLAWTKGQGLISSSRCWSTSLRVRSAESWGMPWSIKNLKFHDNPVPLSNQPRLQDGLGLLQQPGLPAQRGPRRKLYVRRDHVQ